MSSLLEIRPLNVNTASIDELYEEARHLKHFLYEDLRRVGASDEEARSIANPDNEEQLLAQLDKMLCPVFPDTVYAKLINDEGMVGYTKVGPRLAGDEAPFGRRLFIMARAREAIQDSANLPRGLHALTVQEGLALAALEKIYFGLVPPSRHLVASVHERDVELDDAFTSMGAGTTKTPKGVIALGSFAASYRRRSLPPHHGKK